MRSAKMKRLFAIQVYAQLSVFGLQFLSIPAYLSAWGSAKYGAWLIFFTLPTLMSQLDIGFGSAAGPVIATSLRRGDFVAARAIFWLGLIASSLLSLVLSLLMWVLASYCQHWIVYSIGFPPFEASVLIYSGLVIAITSIFSRNIYTGFIASDHQPLGEMLIASIGTIDGLTTLAALLLFEASPLALAIALGITRLGSLAVLILVSILTCPHIWSINDVSLKMMQNAKRQIDQPALGYFFNPVSSFLQNQGIIVIVGLTGGPAAATIVYTHRFVARASAYLMAALRSITSGEIMHLLARGESYKFKMAALLTVSAFLWISALVLIFLLLLGPLIMNWWLSRNVAFNGPLFYSFSLVGFLYSISLGMKTVLTASNNHFLLSRAELICTVITMVLVAASSAYTDAMLPLGILMCLFSVCLAIIASREFVYHLGFSMRELVAGAILTAPRFVGAWLLVYLKIGARHRCL